MDSKRSGHEFFPQVQTRFTQRIEAKKIIQLIDKLEIKKNKLNQAAIENGAGSLEYKKNVIITELHEYYNKKLKTYNQSQPSLHNADEMQALINFLQDIYAHYKTVLEEKGPILKQFREDYRQTAQYSVFAAAWLAVGAAFIYAPPTAAIGTLVAADVISAKIGTATGLTLEYPESYSLLKEIVETLEKTIDNLRFSFETQYPACVLELPDKDNMTCPILKIRMQHPFLCTLDGFSYEEKPIRKWLEEKRSSPIIPSRKMLPSQKVDDVIKENIDLRQLIEKDAEQIRQQQRAAASAQADEHQSSASSALNLGQRS